jgi:hypothetical protein
MGATSAAIKAIDGELAARARGDRRIARLTTIPGVGAVSAQTLVAAVDRIERFASAKKLIAYAGLAPSVRASGERVEYGRITKQGRAEIRAVWAQAAHSVLIAKSGGGATPPTLGRTGRAPTRAQDGGRGAGAEVHDDRLSSAARRHRLRRAAAHARSCLTNTGDTDETPYNGERHNETPNNGERRSGIPPAAGEPASKA